jgi:hypothetical protein
VPLIIFERCKGSNNFRYGKIFFENNLQITEKENKKNTATRAA